LSRVGVTASITAKKNAVPKLARSIERILEDVLDVAAIQVVGRMQHHIVRVDFIDTGATLNSVTVKSKDRLERAIGPTTHYAIYGEFGTSRMRARPFAAPALKDVRRPVEKAMGAAIVKFVKEN
jgi:HK97 gp10 family phage protein